MFIYVPHVLCSLLTFNVLKRTMALEWRIFEGDDLQYDAQSYLVNLDIRVKNRLGITQCSGSIVSSSWIITAAHCIKSNLRSVRVMQSTKNGTKIIAKIKKHNVFRHPYFIPNENTDANKENDIALLRLKPPVALDDDIKPMELSTRRPKFGQTATIAGYGLTEDYVEPPREGTVIIKRCSEKIVNIICTRGSIRAAPGDSGGPLIYKGAIAGVISSGCKHVQINRLCLTVYCSVAFHSEWINYITEKTLTWKQ